MIYNYIMTGGLIQLVAYGVQDLFLTHDPQITFFKVVYRRHTNFSTEHIPQNFIDNPDFGKRVTCFVSKRGDLIGKSYIVLTLPRINQFYSEQNTLDNLTKIAWMRKIGYGIIKYIEIEIGGKVIDKHYGEWLNIWHEIFLPKGHNDMLNKMIGNIPEMTDFTNGKDEYTLYIPLQFWFCTNSGLALPVVCLQFGDVKISMELNEAENCYIVTPTHYIETYSDIVNIQPYEYIEQTINGQTASGLFTGYDFITKRMYYKKISANDFQSITSTVTSISDITSTIFDNPKNSKYFIKGLTSGYMAMPKFNITPQSQTAQYSQIINMSIPSCFLLLEYIYVDTEERGRMLNKRHDYLIEQVTTINQQIIESTNRITNIDLFQPTKLMIWILQQNYLTNSYNNDIFNYTDSYKYSNNNLIGKSLILQETIKLNGTDRVSKRGYQYFNHIQGYQHAKHNLCEGINMYSFGVQVNKHQPSGSCNMSAIDGIQIDLTNKNIVTISNPAYLRTYSISYNVFRVVNGISGLVFSR